MRIDRLISAFEPTHDAVERDPFEVRHRDEVAVALDPDLERLDDVGMIQPSGDTRLVEEHLDHFGILLEVRVKRLDDDQLLESTGPRGEREEHFTRAPLSERGEDLVAADGSLTHEPYPVRGCRHRTNGIEVTGEHVLTVRASGAGVNIPEA